MATWYSLPASLPALHLTNPDGIDSRLTCFWKYLSSFFYCSALAFQKNQNIQEFPHWLQHQYPVSMNSWICPLTRISTAQFSFSFKDSSPLAALPSSPVSSVTIRV